MADRPIIFSAPMIRAMLDGWKTQTRRVIRGVARDNCMSTGKGNLRTHVMDAPDHPNLLPIHARSGDRLWVREAWSATFWTPEDIDAPPREYVSTPANERTRDLLSGVYYREAEERKDWRTNPPFVPEGRWASSIHMPRWASRLTLVVTDVRVERVQDISEADAVAEGVEPAGHGAAFVQLSDALTYSTPRGCFAVLWDSINGKRHGCAWEDNPWVVAITYDAHRANIDALGAEVAA